MKRFRRNRIGVKRLINKTHLVNPSKVTNGVAIFACPACKTEKQLVTDKLNGKELDCLLCGCRYRLNLPVN
jgi:transcription elongation factor Elf1